MLEPRSVNGVHWHMQAMQRVSQIKSTPGPDQRLHLEHCERGIVISQVVNRVTS